MKLTIYILLIFNLNLYSDICKELSSNFKSLERERILTIESPLFGVKNIILQKQVIDENITEYYIHTAMGRIYFYNSLVVLLKNFDYTIFRKLQRIYKMDHSMLLLNSFHKAFNIIGFEITSHRVIAFSDFISKDYNALLEYRRDKNDVVFFFNHTPNYMSLSHGLGIKFQYFLTPFMVSRSQDRDYKRCKRVIMEDLYNRNLPYKQLNKIIDFLNLL